MVSRYRRATGEDAHAVAHLYLAARKAAIPTIPPPAHEDDQVLAWLSGRITGGQECWVTEDDSGLTALLLLEPGWIDQLYVRPDLTGRGIGSDLVEIAKARMPDGLRLWTFQSNRAARRFYERHGFRAIRYTDGTENEERSPDVLYEWLPADDQPVKQSLG